MSDVQRLGILVKRFPKLSETFILSEIIALEAQGKSLGLFTLLPPSDEIEQADVRRVKAVPEQLEPSPWAEVFSHLIRQPRAAARAIWLSVKYAGTGFGSVLGCGVDLARRIRAQNVSHLHSHFADTPSMIAEIASVLSGVPFSISAHAKDIYTTPTKGLASRLRAARFTTTCTSHNADFLKQIAPDARIAQNYHGLDLDRFDAATRAAPSEIPLILSVGRLRHKKGFDTLIDACALLAAEGTKFQCEIIGYGPEEDALRRQIEARGLKGVVRLSGKRPQDEVLARMKSAAVFALPCRVLDDGDRDGIPNVILEALALQTPVVSTRVSGIPEIITHEKTGLLVEPDDAAALKIALLQILTCPEDARAFAVEGQNAVQSEFSLPENIRSLVSALDQAPLRETIYILKGFPRLSESFITNEIRILEQSGLPLRIFSIKSGDKLGVETAGRLASPQHYLPAMTSLSGSALVPWLIRNSVYYMPAAMSVLRRRPKSFLRTLKRAFRMTQDYRDETTGRSRKVFIKEFLQACWIARELLKLNTAGHLHGHFCHGATTVTSMVSALTGLPYSFTAHAKDIYQEDLNPRDLLPKKMAQAQFVVTCTQANHQHLSGLGPDARAICTRFITGWISHDLNQRKSGHKPSRRSFFLSGDMLKRKGSKTSSRPVASFAMPASLSSVTSSAKMVRAGQR